MRAKWRATPPESLRECFLSGPGLRYLTLRTRTNQFCKATPWVLGMCIRPGTLRYRVSWLPMLCGACLGCSSPRGSAGLVGGTAKALYFVVEVKMGT